MLSPDEIIITLRDLTTAGFAKIEGSLTSVETKANATNLSGFSKSAKTVEKDAAAAAGTAGGSTGIMGMISAMTGIPGPAAIAVVGVAALTGVLIAAGNTYEKVEKQENLLNVALQAHGSSLDKERDPINALIKANESWGQTADDTRAAILELAQAGQSMSDIEAAMPAILDLATAKHEDLATAAKQVELAEMGNARALKELGIILPKTGISTKDLQTAQDAVTQTTNTLSTAQDKLSIVQDKLKDKTSLTAAETLQLQQAQDAVTAAQDKVTASQEQLTIVQEGGSDAATRQQLVLTALTKQLGNQQGGVDTMEIVTAKLNNTWENFAVKVGPQVRAAIASLLTNAVIPLMDDINSLIDYLGQVYGWLEKTGVLSAFGTVFQMTVVTPLQIGYTTVKDLIGLLQTLWQKLEDVGKAIQNSPIGSLGGAIGKAKDALGGLTGLIPHFAGGGVVQGSGPVPIIAHGGEGVFTPDQMAALAGGGGGNHFHVHFDSLVTPTPQQMRDVAHALEPEFARMLALRGTAALGGGF